MACDITQKDGEVHSILELLYNHKHKRGRLVVENAFGILKQIFREFKKIKLHVTIAFDVFSACFLLHNLLLARKEVEVEEVMRMI
jgi:hypothetical protein